MPALHRGSTFVTGFLSLFLAFLINARFAVAAPSDASLPQGVKTVWELDKAFQEKTSTRQRICLNGLWRWQPAPQKADTPPTDSWGFAKVPGPWPGCSGNWMWNNTQTHFPHPTWAKSNLDKVSAGWYQREFAVPADWAGRRIAISMDYLNSAAAVYMDGQNRGEAFFPGGEVDITAACTPGKHILSIFVAAVPLGEETAYFAEGGMGPRSKAKVDLRGLCGDVFLSATPAQSRLSDVKIETSVRNWTLTINAAIDAAKPDAAYTFRAQITDLGKPIKEFASPSFKAADLRDGRFTFTVPWHPDKLWDTITPANQYDLQVTLQDSQGKPLDTFLPIRFGFRELWIDGKDFRLNGTRIYCFALPLDSAQISPATATYDGATETFKRLKACGINMVYTHNYGCEPGSHLAFTEILRAADDAGILLSFSLPHVSSYDWKKKDTEAAYARHTEYYIRQAQNHPAVTFYAMSHNFCGYDDEHNPDHIDGQRDMTGKIAQPSDNNVKLALRGQAIAQRFDNSRIIYHHGSANLGQTFTLNIYLNQVPAQERDDWFAHWSTEGIKPLFLGEYGTPSDLDWSTYRGWYKGERSWGNAAVAYEMCFPEWGAQYRGDQAFDMTDLEKDDLRYEARQWRKLAAGNGKPWFRWDYPHPIGEHSFVVPNVLDVLAMYIPDNWRAYRTWGVSAFNSWEWLRMWDLKPGFKRQKKIFTTDWDHLQRPGYSPDFIDKPYEGYEYAYETTDWVPSLAAQALLKNNQPILAYIAGGPDRFVTKDHNFLPGQRVDKQIIIINNSRQPITADCSWALALPQGLSGSKQVDIETGEQARIPLHLPLPTNLPPGSYALTLKARFRGAGVSPVSPAPADQTDSFTIDILAPQKSPPKLSAKIALFDPKGETRKLLQELSVPFQSVDPATDLAPFDLLIVGKAALTPDSPAPDISRVKDGLKVLIFEQTTDTLQNRFGFRVTEYGLRWLFKRIPDHPALAGLSDANLRDWRGDATITPPRLQYAFDKYKTPEIQWCGITVTRPWRCGNTGNLASILIEKPARGDFLPILDGGFSLQYSPLMEYREGQGLVLFCQADVTGRTDTDPAAQCLARNIIAYAATWKLAPIRKVLYAGPDAGRAWLEKDGIAADAYNGGPLTPDQILIVGTGGGKQLAPSSPSIRSWLSNGGNLLAIGLDESEAQAFLPFKITTKKSEYIGIAFDPFPFASLLAGVGPADLHNRDPRDLPLITSGAASVANGVLAKGQTSNVVFCQLAPWDFDYTKGGGQFNLKRTFRRSSFALSRILANMGAAESTPILDRFHTPAGGKDHRYLEGLYLDQPEEMDDPYRFFCW